MADGKWRASGEVQKRGRQHWQKGREKERKKGRSFLLKNCLSKSTCHGRIDRARAVAQETGPRKTVDVDLRWQTSVHRSIKPSIAPGLLEEIILALLFTFFNQTIICIMVSQLSSKLLHPLLYIVETARNNPIKVGYCTKILRYVYTSRGYLPLVISARVIC